MCFFFIYLLGVPFPKNFMSVAKTILKRLFRVYAHIYHQHFDPVIQLQEEAHLNTSFKHFIFFVQVSSITRSFLLSKSSYIWGKYCIHTIRIKIGHISLVFIFLNTCHDGKDWPFVSEFLHLQARGMQV